MIKIDSKEKITRLISFYSSDFDRIKKILSSYPNINDTQAFILFMYVIAFVLKTTVSERQYGNIVINLFEDNDNYDKNSLALGGYIGKSNDKYTINLYPLCIQCLTNREIKEFCQSLITFAHEVFHMKQDMDVDSKIFDIFTILYSLEFLLKEDDYGFYKSHYQDLACEITAETYGAIVTKKFLQQFNNKIGDLDFEDWILKITRLKYKNFLKEDSRNKYLCELIQLALDKKIINSSSLEKYPILKTIFNENGKLQSTEYFTSLQNEFKKSFTMSDLSDLDKRSILEAIESLIEVSKIIGGRKI